MVKFGERMKAARTAKHMSQQALADIIGKSLNTVGLYERGLRQPSQRQRHQYVGARRRLPCHSLCDGQGKDAAKSRLHRKRSGGARGQNRESSGSELNKERPSFRRAERRLRRTCIARPLFCRNDERIFVKLVKSLTYSRAICKIETVTACERKAGL